MRAKVLILTLAVAAVPAPAWAQQPQPIPRAVVDVRGFYSGLGRDPVTASDLEIDPTALPSRALGGVVGVHVYPIRGSHIALGLGAEIVAARASAQQKDADGQPIGMAVHQLLRGITPGFSLNFGHRLGWSYLSAAMGPLALESYLGDTAPTEPVRRTNTISLGAGARWFSTNHLAFCFDLHFYLTRPANNAPPYPGRQRSRLTVLSAGVAFK